MYIAFVPAVPENNSQEDESNNRLSELEPAPLEMNTNSEVAHSGGEIWQLVESNCDQLGNFAYGINNEFDPRTAGNEAYNVHTKHELGTTILFNEAYNVMDELDPTTRKNEAYTTL